MSAGDGQVSKLLEKAGQKEKNPNAKRKGGRNGEKRSEWRRPGPSVIPTKVHQETAFATTWLNEPVHSSFCLTKAVSVWVIGISSVPKYSAKGSLQVLLFDAHESVIVIISPFYRCEDQGSESLRLGTRSCSQQVVELGLKPDCLQSNPQSSVTLGQTAQHGISPGHQFHTESLSSSCLDSIALLCGASVVFKL